jgi:hypothetical protein
VIEKNQEIKFIMNKENEMIDKETHNESLGPTHSMYMEDNTFPTPPQGVLTIFLGDGIMDPKRHMDKFITICDIHLIQHDDVMVRFFLQTLIGPTYEWYISLPTQSISSFDDLESIFMTMYAYYIA